MSCLIHEECIDFFSLSDCYSRMEVVSVWWLLTYDIACTIYHTAADPDLKPSESVRLSWVRSRRGHGVGVWTVGRGTGVEVECVSGEKEGFW